MATVRKIKEEDDIIITTSPRSVHIPALFAESLSEDAAISIIYC